MKAKRALAGLCAGAFLMCNAAIAGDTTTAPPPQSGGPTSVLPEELRNLAPGTVVLLEVPGNVRGSVEIVAVPIEVLAMMLMQDGVQIERAPQRPSAPEPREPTGVGI